MEVFFDNDVVIKLAEYELLDALIDLMAQCDMTTFVLPTLGFVAGLNNPKRAEKLFSSADKLVVIKRLIETSGIAEIRQTATIQLVSQLSAPGLDPGELTLIACATEVSGTAGIITGDKRAIQVLNNVTELTKLLKHCLIILLEHVVRHLINALEPAFVISKVEAKPDIDTALRVCFKGKSVSALSQIHDGLNSYIRDVESNCNHLKFISS